MASSPFTFILLTNSIHRPSWTGIGRIPLFNQASTCTEEDFQRLLKNQFWYMALLPKIFPREFCKKLTEITLVPRLMLQICPGQGLQWRLIDLQLKVLLLPLSLPPRKSSPYQYALTWLWHAVSQFYSDFVLQLTFHKDDLEYLFLSFLSVKSKVTGLTLIALKFCV